MGWEGIEPPLARLQRGVQPLHHQPLWEREDSNLQPPGPKPVASAVELRSLSEFVNQAGSPPWLLSVRVLLSC